MVARVIVRMMANRSDRRLLTLRGVRAFEAAGMSTRTRRADFHHGQGSFATPVTGRIYDRNRFSLSVPHPCTRAGSIYDTTFLYWLSDFVGEAALDFADAARNDEVRMWEMMSLVRIRGSRATRTIVQGLARVSRSSSPIRAARSGPGSNSKSRSGV